MQVGDRYLDALEHKPRARRAGTLVIAVLLHGAAITTLALWGYYHLDEVPAPPTQLIYHASTPPSGGGGIKIERFKKQPVQKVAKHDPLVQPVVVKNLVDVPPANTPEPNSDTTGTGGTGGEGGNGGAGGAGGNGNGDCVGANCTDKPVPAGRAKLIDPEVARAQKIGGDMPRYSERARAAGVEGTVAAKICVTSQGGVSTVTLLRGLPLLDETVLNAVRGWRYKPFTVGERAMPFCYVANFEFHLQGR